MSLGAWIFLAATWSVVGGVTVYLFAKVLRRPQSPSDD